MPRPRPDGLQKETSRHGKTVWYVRVGHGPRVRIKAAYGTPEFKEAYQAALKGVVSQPKAKAPNGSLEWLWMLYRQAGAWTTLSLATRKQRENIMKPVLSTAGREPLSKITKASVEAGVRRRAATPTQAKHFVTSLRGMFEWALASNLARVDPTHGIAFKTKRGPKPEGFPAWNDVEMAAYERRWPRGTRERVAFDVYQYTGLRRGDAAAVGKQHVKNGVIGIQTEKTGMWVYIPVHPELQLTLDAGPIGDLAFIAQKNGNPLTKESLGNFFRDACDAAGIKKSAHGIRKAVATAAADNGATESELEAIFAWSGGQMASLYTRTANRKRLAAGASHKMARTKSETSIPAPDDKVREGELKPQTKQG
jgi:integrase